MERVFYKKSPFNDKYVFPINSGNPICPCCRNITSLAATRAPEDKNGLVHPFRYHPQETRIYKCLTEDCERNGKKVYLGNRRAFDEVFPEIDPKEVLFATESMGSYESVSEGVSYNPEKGTLSIYQLGRTWYIPPHGKANIKIPERYRRTFNLNTGESFYNRKGLSVNLFERTDWRWSKTGCGDYYYVGTSVEAIRAFVNKAFEIINLPVAFDYRYDSGKNRKNNFIFSLGHTTMVCHTEDDMYAFVQTLISAPNILIRYDAYKGTIAFRENIFVRDTLTASSIRTIDSIMTAIPTTKAFRHNQPKVIMDEAEYINKVCNDLCIPKTKQLMKLYRRNPMTMGYVEYLDKVGFKKIDNIVKFIRLALETPLDVLAFTCRMPKTQTFLKALIKACGETAAANKLIQLLKSNYMSWNFLDIVKLYSEVVSKGRRKIALKGTLEDIHTELSIQFKKLSNKNAEIPYSKEELRRIGSYGRFTVNVAKDTDELIEIGERMHICVGGYRNEALSKRSSIYYIEDVLEKKYVACIELQKNKLVQVKGYCNTMLEGSVADAAAKWISDRKISHKLCGDYQRMKTTCDMVA